MTRKRSPLYVTTLIAGAFFMENLDGTIIATALPQMSRSFHVSAVSLNIGMTAYLLTLAVFIPISGWVADRYGSRSVFATAIGVFTLASLFCGLSQTLTQFTLMRILQGIGGAMMVPVGRLVVLRTTPKDQLTQAIAYISWPGLTALVIGPPLGGFITTYVSWHWIFFLNLPLGILALVLTMLWVENVRTDEVHPFDWTTFLLAGFASTGVVYAMEKFGAEGVRWQVPGIILALSLLSGALAIWVARRKPATSLIDLESMKRKTYSLSIYGASAFRIAVSVLPFLLPLMFQISFGLNAFQSGIYLLALFAGDLSMKAFVIQVLRRFGFRRILIVNGVITAASIALCAILTPVHATCSDHRHPVLPRRLPVHGVHLHDDARILGDSVRQDEPRQWVPQRSHAAQHGIGRRRGSHHPAAGRPCAWPLRRDTATSRFPLCHSLYGRPVARTGLQQPRSSAGRRRHHQRPSPTGVGSQPCLSVVAGAQSYSA